jgi:aminopeptidase YwaD
MKKLLLLLILFSQVAIGQRLKKQEKAIIEDLKTTINFLSSDKLEGRKTGSPGEMLASNYLAAEFKKAGLLPKGENDSYIQAFLINEGKQILPETFLIINGDSLKIGQDFFPMSFSANGIEEAFASPAFQEKGMPWFLDIREMLDQSSQNPHFDLRQAIKKMLMESVQKGATSLIVFNSGNAVSDLQFDGKSTADSVNVPVIFITKNVADKYLKDASSNVDIKMKVAIGAKTRQGHNVIGFIDNGAANTIIIGAHYDHLGWGEDQNSLAGGKPEIHNGADDNASGTAAVLQLAKLLKGSKLKNDNYLFICFSGEELGLFGSKYFTAHPTIGLEAVNYMINCDMIGRLNDDTKSISVGGFGTSPIWGKILPSRTKSLNVKFDSSGIGPSDHTSFYLKNIPVLFFFTGTHPDYHKPTDDADKINYTGELRVIQYIYDVISETNKSGKIPFSKTRDLQMNGPQFSVTLGILPDYTSSENGLGIDAIIEGKIAEDAGMKAGDIIKALGDYKVSDINSYMAALSKFRKGDATKVIILRGQDTKTFDIIF